MISPAFSRSELPNQTQTILLCLLGVFIPPLPIYILTGPKYTVKTKQFLICCILSLTFYFYLLGLIYSLHFVLVTFPQARLAPNGAGYYRARDLENHPAPAAAPAAPSTSAAPAPAAPVSQHVSPSDETDQPLLPAYQEVEGSSNGYPRDNKVGHGDHKVQH